MKTTLPFVAVLCLLILSAIGLAQETAQQTEQPREPSFSQMRSSPVGQQLLEANWRGIIRSSWEGRGVDIVTIQVIESPARAVWDISDEQMREFKTLWGMNRVADTEMPKIDEEMTRIMASGVLFAESVDEETLQHCRDTVEKGTVLVNGFAVDALDNVLTPEQKEKIQESQLANMGDIPIISPSMFEVLDLTDPQKQQMEAIKKELGPEFEKILDSYAKGELTLMNKVWDALEKEGVSLGKGIMDGKDVEAAKKKLMETNPEYKRIYEFVQSQSRAFSTRLKTKMFDVLTDEQWARLQKLIDDPPEHALALRKKLKELVGENEKPGMWTPGPSSWQPGDAIPEQYRQERNSRSRFPR